MDFQIRCYPCSSVFAYPSGLLDIGGGFKEMFSDDTFFAFGADEVGCFDLFWGAVGF